MSWRSAGKLGSPAGEREAPSPLPTLGVGESWFLFLVFFFFFCLYCKLLGFGARATDAAEPPLPGAAGRPLRGAGTPREPPGPKPGAQEERVAAGRERGHEGLRLPLCPARGSPGQAPREPLPREALAEEERSSRHCLCTFPFHPHGSCCDQDSPINPTSVILFCSPPPLFLWLSPDFTLVPFLFWFFALLAWSLWPGAHHFPVSNSLSLWFLLQLFVPPLKPPLLQNWCLLDDLQSLNPPPGVSQLG